MSERKAFEEWAYSNKWNIFRVRDMGVDRYVDDFVDGAWTGWKASASREGYKLAPIQNICVHHHWVESAVNDEVMQCVICGVFE